MAKIDGLFSGATHIATAIGEAALVLTPAQRPTISELQASYDEAVAYCDERYWMYQRAIEAGDNVVTTKKRVAWLQARHTKETAHKRLLRAQATT